MSLQADVAAAFRKHVLQPLYKPGQWKVLIMDDRATKVLSSVYRMQDITEFGITLVESIYRMRKSFKMEAIYLMYPNVKEVELLLQDFSSDTPKYLLAHVFFLLPCPSEILKRIATSRCIRFFKTLSQLDLDFIPIEPCIYTFECRDVGITHPLPPTLCQDKLRVLEHLAEQLATVCVTLEEYPKICFRKTESNMKLAHLTQLKLDACRDSNPNMGQGLHKDRSVLLILDRGFDPISPLVHELTLQAMCHDLLKITDNVYTCDTGKKVNLSEQNPLWKELRHTHIAHVSSDLPARVREFAASKKQFLALQKSKPNESGEGGYVNEGATMEAESKDSVGLKDLSNLIRQLPQFQAEAAYYSALYVVTDACMRIFRQGADRLCILEQDLVMGQTAQGDVVRDPMRLLVDMFHYDFASVEDRLRLLMIFALIKDGISESHLDKLLDTAQLPRINKALFASLSLLLGAQIIQPEPMSFGSSAMSGAGSGPQITFGQIECLNRLPPVSSVSDQVQRFLPVKNKRKDRFESTPFAHSRWTPYLVDLMEEIIENKLDSRLFAFLPPRNTGFAPNTKPQMMDSSRDFKGPSARFRASGSPSSMHVPSTSGSHRLPSPGLNMFSSGIGSSADHCGPRLIVCIVGGATWSEARSAYQMTQRCIDTRLAESDRHTLGRAPPDGAVSSILPGGGGVGWNWEVMLGGTHMITPVAFLKDLELMSQQFLGQNNTVGIQQPSGMSSGRKSIQTGFHRF